MGIATTQPTTVESYPPSSISLEDASTTPLYEVLGSPISGTGTFSLILEPAVPNTVFAGPTSGNAAQPNFRAIIPTDIPVLNQNTTGTSANVTGTVAVANGGTGQTTANAALNALLPPQTGNAGDVLATNGANTSWVSAGGGGGANTALSNLVSVAVNTSLLPGTTNSQSLGSTSLAWSSVFAPLVEGAASAGTLTLQGGTAASNGVGGNVVLQGAAGSNVGTGGNGGTVNISGAAAQGNGTSNQTGGAVNVTAGASVGSGIGGTITLQCGTGGTGTGTAGATGGTVNINGGTGGAGSATSGQGGSATLKAGSGGGGAAGAQGGQASVTGGTGGTGSASGGNGGAVQISGGSPASFAGAAGGTVTIASGNGTGTGSGGAGGSLTLNSGTAGGDNTASNTGGSISIVAGHSAGSSSGPQVTITAGAGGVGSGATGASGGNMSVSAGAGGTGSGTGGAGGNLVLSAGQGGNSGTPGTGGFIQFFTSAGASSVEHLRITAVGEILVSNADVQIQTAGFGLQIKAGSNCKLGTVQLAGGTATVANTAVTANSLIFLTSQADGGTPGFVRVTAKTAGTSFVITSSNGADTSTVAWMIVEKM